MSVTLEASQTAEVANHEISLEEENWQFDDFTDGVMKNVRTIQKEQLQKCINDYVKQLNGFAQSLEASADNYWTSIASNNCSIVDADLSLQENTTIAQLMQNTTKDQELDKMLLVFSTLCCEIKFLKKLAANKFYPMLLFYGEDQATDNADENQGEVFEKITAFLPQIIELSQFIDRCQVVYRNMMCQLAALYSKKQKHPLSSVSLTCLMEHVALLLGIMLRLDEIILFNQILREHWGKYKFMVKSIGQTPSMFSTSADEVMPLEKWIVEMEGEIFDQNILVNCISQNIEDSGTLFLNNKVLKDHFQTAVHVMLVEAENALSKNGEFAARSSLVSLVLLFCLHYHLFRELDVKMNKRLWDIMKKTAAINLIGPVVWYAPEFVLTSVPPSGKSVDKKVLAAIDNTRQSGLKDAPAMIQKQLHYATVAVAQWQINFESGMLGKRKTLSEKSVLDTLKSKMRLCYAGLNLARSISCLVKIILPIYIDSGQQMSSKVALQIMRLIEIIKMIHLTITSSSYAVNKHLPLMMQNLQGFMLRQLQVVFRKFPKNKELKGDIAHGVAALKHVALIVAGPVNPNRLLCCNLMLEYALQKLRSQLRDEEISGLFDNMGQLHKVMTFSESVNEACDCVFLNWGKACIPVYLSNMLTCKLQPAGPNILYSPSNSGIPLIFAALKDIVFAMDNCGPQADSLKFSFETEILDYVEKYLMTPLRLEIETDLRYATHVHLNVKDSNPVKQAVVSNDLKPLVNLRPFRFMSGYINIGEQISSHLTQMFYNLTTITPQDWQAYTAMKFCALERYGDAIQILDGKLPQQTLEQGLDVLEIMRNIHVFVGHYYYNLNNQVFVEQATANNRHVNTINIRHIANSMRTHGTGIMNTTVNYSFQYLTKQFRIFSQFLYDEHIKGKLIKEIRFFREKKDQLDQMYPYERAEKLNKSIRRLGLTKDNLSYLDEFRKLISQIGNAMGFVRMIRSGGLNTCSHAIEFVPDLDDIVSFEEQVKAERLSSETEEAARIFDTCLENLNKNFAEGTDYFRLFVSVFSPEFRKDKNVHLKNFYVIVPALMINYVEYIKQAKEQMLKKNKTGALFTDDGFAMGVSFILALLDQNGDYDSLHWFDSIAAKLKSEMEDTVSRQKSLNSNNREDQKQLQAADLTFRRIELYRKEFDLLFFSFSSARIFFQQPDPDDMDEDVM